MREGVRVGGWQAKICENEGGNTAFDNKTYLSQNQSTDDSYETQI